MGFSHNYISGARTKPTRGATTTGELVVNISDGTLWTKDLSGNVVRTALPHMDREWKVPELRDGIQVFNPFESIKWKFLTDNTIIVTGIVRGGLNGIKVLFEFPEYVSRRIESIQYGAISTTTVSHRTLMRSYVTGGGTGFFCTQIQGSNIVDTIIVNQMIILDM